MIDLLYVAFNRLEFTMPSFRALAENTDWSEVRALFVHDDGSTDGTDEWLARTAMTDVPKTVQVVLSKRAEHEERGPVAAMNRYLDWHAEAADDDVGIFAKIDNDFVVCPGWLTEMLRMTTADAAVDALGVEPMFGPAIPPPYEQRFSRLAKHIGGKGLIRHRIFEQCRPRPRGVNGYQGWTQYQTEHRELTLAWIAPDLPCFGLDQLPFEPWQSLTTQYEEQSWGRRWPEYPNDLNMRSYWAWWAGA